MSHHVFPWWKGFRPLNPKRVARLPLKAWARAFAASAFLFLPAFAAAQKADFTFMSDFLRENGLAGTVIVENLSGSLRYVHGESTSDLGYLPASTFKIANTLIALEEGAVKDADEFIAWDGKDKGLSDWNHDQSILTALPSSCVWFYQELARRVGNTAYLRWLKTIGYGNGKTGPILDSFWLDGDLRISPNQEIAFLKKVYREDFPFKKSSYAVVKEALIVKRTASYVLRAKTGWTQRVRPQIGWYVGWLEAKGCVWFFAVRLDLHSDSDAPFREKAALKALLGLGLLP
jgi:beta-lactamase class D